MYDPGFAYTCIIYYVKENARIFGFVFVTHRRDNKKGNTYDYACVRIDQDVCE